MLKNQIWILKKEKINEKLRERGDFIYRFELCVSASVSPTAVQSQAISQNSQKSQSSHIARRHHAARIAAVPGMSIPLGDAGAWFVMPEHSKQNEVRSLRKSTVKHKSAVMMLRTDSYTMLISRSSAYIRPTAVQSIFFSCISANYCIFYAKMLFFNMIFLKNFQMQHFFP